MQRISGYVFNTAEHWYHVVVEHTTADSQNCSDTTPPGSIDIWVNGIKWNGSIIIRRAA